MNILMVLNERFPADARLEKEIPALLAAGHRVVVVASDDADSREADSEFEILRLRLKSRGKARRILFKLSNLDFLLIAELIYKLMTTYPDFKPDAIHVHDLPWARVGCAIADHYQAKLVLDFHENFPAAMEAYKANSTVISDRSSMIRSQFENELFNRQARWLWYEKQMVDRADRVIVVVPEAIDRFTQANMDPAKFVVVSNTEDPTQWQPASSATAQSPFTVSYVGGGGLHRGIDTLVSSADYVASKQLRIVIVGLKPGSDFRNYIESLAINLKQKESVDLVDWVPTHQVQGYIDSSDLCAVPHNDFEHTQTTVPHKLFQYMAMQKPVLVSDVAPLKRIVEETESGVVFEAGNPKSCAEMITRMMNNREQGHQMGLNGRTATSGPYNWNRDAARLVELYENLTPHR